jgi:hypothetical protein
VFFLMKPTYRDAGILYPVEVVNTDESLPNASRTFLVILNAVMTVLLTLVLLLHLRSSPSHARDRHSLPLAWAAVVSVLCSGVHFTDNTRRPVAYHTPRWIYDPMYQIGYMDSAPISWSFTAMAAVWGLIRAAPRPSESDVAAMVGTAPRDELDSGELGAAAAAHAAPGVELGAAAAAADAGPRSLMAPLRRPEWPYAAIAIHALFIISGQGHYLAELPTQFGWLENVSIFAEGSTAAVLLWRLWIAYSERFSGGGGGAALAVPTDDPDGSSESDTASSTEQGHIGLRRRSAGGAIPGM